MSGWLNNDCPPRPQGVGDTRAQDTRPAGLPSAGGSDPNGGIVPAGAPLDQKRPALSAASGLFFCALGGAVATSDVAVIAPAFVGYGFVACAAADSAEKDGGFLRKVLAAVVSLAVAGVLALPDGAAAVVGAVMVCLVALAAAALLVTEKLTPGMTCVVVGAAAAAQLGVDALFAASQGTTLAAVMETLLDSYLSQLGTTSLDLAAQLETVRAVLAVVWPVAYVVSAVGELLFARLGVGLAVPRVGEKAPKLPAMAAYDLPLWVVAVLIVAVAGFALTVTVDALSSDVLLMVTANVVLALRFAFAAQGLAVLTWLVREKHVGGLAAGLLAVAALYLEVQFFVVTLVGLVDVWANFRHLQRGEAPTDDGTTKQDKEPAKAD